MPRLDVATRQWHAGVESVWLALAAPSVTRADYVSALIRTYGFVAPLESACRYTPGLERSLETWPLTRAGLLAQDLLTLGVLPARLTSIPQCRWITTFLDVPEALGWLYVGHRMSMVQEGLAGHLTMRLPEVDGACAYLAAGERRSIAWEAYERTIDRTAAKPEVANDIVAAASEAFTCANRWAADLDLVEWRITG